MKEFTTSQFHIMPNHRSLGYNIPRLFLFVYMTVILVLWTLDQERVAVYRVKGQRLQFFSCMGETSEFCAAK